VWAGKQSRCVIIRQGRLSLTIPLWVGVVKAGKWTGTPCSSPISVVLQCKLTSALRFWNDFPLSCPFTWCWDKNSFVWYSTLAVLSHSAVGCSNLVPPSDAWLRRTDNEATIGCYTTRQRWNLRCDGNQWKGTIGVCRDGIVHNFRVIILRFLTAFCKHMRYDCLIN